MEKIKETLKSTKFAKVFYLVGIVLVVLIIFQAGVFVGFKKASFSNRWGENYKQTFGGQHRGMMGEMMGFGSDYVNSHGATGKIIKLELPKIIMLGSDNVEKSIVTNSDTLVRSFRDEIKTTDLKVDDYLVVIGSPNSAGEIEAKLIRVLPVNITK